MTNNYKTEDDLKIALNRPLAQFLLQKGIQTRCHHPDIKNQSADEYGCPFTTLVQGILKPEGDLLPCWHTSASPAMIRQFLSELDYWLSGRNSIIWRIPPQIEINQSTSFEDPPQCLIYCRLTARHL